MSFSKFTELCNYHHNPILEHCHLPNKTVNHRSCCQPQVSACCVSFPSLHSQVLSLFPSIRCIEWLPTCFPVRDSAWAISYPVEVGHKCTHVHTHRHTHTTTQGADIPPPHPAPQGEVQHCSKMLPTQLLQVCSQFSKAAGKQYYPPQKISRLELSITQTFKLRSSLCFLKTIPMNSEVKNLRGSKN